MTRHVLGTLTEPNDSDRTQALVTSVHMSREVLSLAERIADSSSKEFQRGMRYIGTALTYLHASCELLPSQQGKITEAPVFICLQRAIYASEAALGHAKLAESYALAPPTDTFAVQQASRSRVIWRKATEAARQEAHRALAAVAALYPEACDFDTAAPEER
jgi:hypothetical protein